MTDADQNNIKESEQENSAEEASSERTEVASGRIGKKAKYALIGAGALVILLIVLTAGMFFVRLGGPRFRMHRKYARIERGSNFREQYGFGKRDGFGMRDRGRDRACLNGRPGRGNWMKGNVLTGKVTEVNGDIFTVETDGKTKKVEIGDSTRFPLNSATKVKVGDTVIVTGEQDSEGTVQAVRIIVSP